LLEDVRESLRRQRYAFDLREWRGLGLTPIVVAPHVDNPDFRGVLPPGRDLCAADGYMSSTWSMPRRR